MRFNLTNKFDLYGQLSDLSNSLNEHDESKLLCNRIIHELKQDFTPKKLDLFLEQLKNYAWISEVEMFLESYSDFLKENKYSIQLENISNKISHVPTYSVIVESIENIILLPESELVGKLQTLNPFRFEPNVRQLLENYESEKYNVQETKTAKITNVISPVMKLSEGYVFSTKSGNYKVSNNITEVTKYEGKLTNEFLVGKMALSLFEHKGNDVFVMNLPKASVKVVANETGKNQLFINETEIKSKEQLNNLVKSTQFIGYTDTNKRAIIDYMVENAHKLVEIDFVKSVETTNENFEIFKTSDNEVSISKLNPKTRTFVLESLSIGDIMDLNKTLKKSHNLDIKHILEGLDINQDSLEFKRLVETIDIKNVADFSKQQEVFETLNKAFETYNKLDVSNKYNVNKHYESLLLKERKIKNHKVKFLLETKTALHETLPEGKQLSESLKLINTELLTILS